MPIRTTELLPLLAYMDFVVEFGDDMHFKTAACCFETIFWALLEAIKAKLPTVGCRLVI
jgi:hypothetical protein